MAFSKGWLLTLVMLSSLPPLFAAGSAMTTLLVRLASRGQEAYVDASVIVEQTIGAIRTVRDGFFQLNDPPFYQK